MAMVMLQTPVAMTASISVGPPAVVAETSTLLAYSSDDGAQPTGIG
jgi:hypothetical protein